jgi:hypothetical protein
MEKDNVFKLLVLAVLMLSALPCASALAEWQVNGKEICTESHRQWEPQITSDGNGGAIITWDDWRTDTDTYAQHVGSGGSVMWTLNGACIPDSHRGDPQITSDGYGGAFITWETWDTEGSQSNIYACRIHQDGWPVWNVLAICTAAGYQWYHQVTSDGEHGAIITWEDGRNADWSIYAQRVDEDGDARWQLNGVPMGVGTQQGSQRYPQLISDGNGGAIITWQDYRSGTNWDIYAQRVDGDENLLWTPNNGGTCICAKTGDQTYPQITSDGNGGAIITWEDYRSGTNWDIYAQRVNGSGTVQWTENGVAIYNGGGAQQGPRIISDGERGAIITWQGDETGNWDIRAQRVNENGGMVWLSGG